MDVLGMDVLGIEAGQDPPTRVMRRETILVGILLSLACLLRPKSSMSWNPSAPNMLHRRAMKVMSMGRCFLARSIPGSGRPLERETINTSDMHAMALVPLMPHWL